MSPRRRFAPGEEPLLTEQAPGSTLWSRLTERVKPPPLQAMPVAMVVAGLLATGAITTSSYVLIIARAHHQVAMKDADVLSFVQAFMTGFTTLDPFHANAYVDRVLAQSTGDFAKQYREKQNQILLQIARAEPTKGATLGAGVERWNEDGSANVLVATEVTVKTPDQKQILDNTNRWVVTAQREGEQWKISSLAQVT